MADRKNTALTIILKPYINKQWKAGDITAVKAMELVGMKKVTFYKRVKVFEAMAAGE